MVEVYGKESSVLEYGMVFLIIKYIIKSIKIASFFKFIFLITREYGRFYLSVFLSTSWNFSFRVFLSFPANNPSSFIDNMLISDFRLHVRIPTLQASVTFSHSIRINSCCNNSWLQSTGPPYLL